GDSAPAYRRLAETAGRPARRLPGHTRLPGASMNRYKAVVFDWDGTVMDSTHAIVASIQGACADLGLPVPDARQASWVIGLSLESALYHAVPTLTADLFQDFQDCYRNHYLSQDGQLPLFDG